MAEEYRRKVLVLCTRNSSRSIIAEALINHELGDKWIAYSAGVKPSPVNPRALQVLAEIGVKPANLESKHVDEFIERDDLDLVITVCDHAKETCPVFLKPVKRVHLGFEDPAPYSDLSDEAALPKFREVRDIIRQEIINYLKSLG